MRYNLSTADNVPITYAGEYLDAESGLIYLRNRYYNPSIGRFITEDPIKDGFNWYAYCGGNPVMYVDPEGKVSKEVADQRIKNNKDTIIKWATEYHVNPVTLGAVIYAKQIELN